MGIRRYGIHSSGIRSEDFGGEGGVERYSISYEDILADDDLGDPYGYNSKNVISFPDELTFDQEYNSSSPAMASTIGDSIITEVKESQDRLTKFVEPTDAEIVAKAMRGWKEGFDDATQATIEKSKEYQDTQREDYQPFVPDPIINPLRDKEVRDMMKQITSWQLADSLGFDEYLLWKQADDEGLTTELTGIVDNRTQAYFESYKDGTWDYNAVVGIRDNALNIWEQNKLDWENDKGISGTYSGRDKEEITNDYTGGGFWDLFNRAGGNKEEFMDELVNWYRVNKPNYNNEELFDAVLNDFRNMNPKLSDNDAWTIDGVDGDELYHKIYGVQRGSRESVEGDTGNVNYLNKSFDGGYATTGWNDIYETFIRNQFGLSSPSLYQHAMTQGMGNDPLQRTIYNQFNLQATEDDPWGGDISGSLVKEDGVGGLATPGKVYDWDYYNNPKENPFDKFLQNYKPMEGNQLTDAIGKVIDVINQEEWESYRPGKSREGGYTDEDLRNYRWRDRYIDGVSAEQNQLSLAAMPIMQNTPLALRAETSRILGNIHTAWKSDPNRNPKEGWLEYVHKNNYFGMIPKDTRSEPQSIQRDWEEQEKYYTKAVPSSEGRDYTPHDEIEAWI